MSLSSFCRNHGQLIPMLRTQLNEMMAAVQNLTRTAGSDEQSRSSLAALNQGMHRQLRLIRQLELEQRLYDEDEVRLSILPTDLVELSHDLLEQVNHLTNSLNIRADFSCDLPALLTLADGGALEDLLLVLISNSLETIGRDGWITLTLEQQDNRAIFTFADSGPGLSADALAALFPSDEEETFTEIGLGLPLARQIALLHGGSLMLDQQSDRSRFLLSLPLRDPNDQLTLCTPLFTDELGGWEKSLVALSHCLPAQAFLPEFEL